MLVVGRREAVVAFGANGNEIANVEDIGVVMQTRDGVFTRKGMNHTTIAAAREVVDRDLRHGVYHPEHLARRPAAADPARNQARTRRRHHLLRLAERHQARRRCRRLRAAVQQQDRLHLHGRRPRARSADRADRASTWAAFRSRSARAAAACWPVCCSAGCAASIRCTA